MWRMLQADEPGTFVLATGKNHSVRDFVTMAFRAVGMELEWEGQGAHEKGIDRATGKTVVAVNPKFYRPAEVDHLIGDAGLARKVLGWEARTDLDEMCRMMVEADIQRNRNGSCF
jgi:GDPmannose 4,6-dehydratase